LLLRERDQFEPDQWLKQLGIARQADALLISLFAYENPAITELLEVWSKSSPPIHCLVPSGKILTSINLSLGENLVNGDIYKNGNLCLQVIPFITQTEYDRLLWACDINFVRGEDSFVRAQWAAKPLIWHIYPQDEDAHITKLSAFLNSYLNAPKALTCRLPGDAIRALWLAWNQNGGLQESWQAVLAQLPEWQQHSREWCNLLVQQPDLASQLVDFCASRQA
jgi:uncharacterized repeat protein (TIGR03837 family)